MKMMENLAKLLVDARFFLNVNQQQIVFICYFSKSGLRRWVLSRDCWSSHSLILASCPDKRMSGTFHPLYSAGRV